MIVGLSRRWLLGGFGSIAVFGASRAVAQVTAPAPAPVQSPAAPGGARQGAAGLSEQDRADVARVEEYLNSIRTLRARFVQATQNGNSRGTFYLARPGRMRLEYDPPVPTVLIANGSQLLHYDSQLRQSAYIPIDSTPAGYLVRDMLRLSGDITVTGVTRNQGNLDVTIVKSRDPGEGRVTFTFQSQPLQLRNWAVVDGQGRLTRVALNEMQVGIPLDNALFRFITNVGQGQTPGGQGGSNN